MAFLQNIAGGTSGNKAEVDVNNNLYVNTPTNVSLAGFINLAGQVQGQTVALNQNRVIPVSSEGRPHVALDRPIFYANFAGSATPANAVPQDALKQTATTMTMSAGSTAGGFLWLNASTITTATTGIAYQTYSTFPTFGGYETRYEFEAMPINCYNAINKCLEFGAGLITDAKTAGLLDGFCFRYTVAGTLIGVISVAGTEYQTSAFATIPTDNVQHRYTIVVTQIACEFYIDGLLQATLAVPTGAVGPGYNTNLPQLIRIYNAGVAPALAPQVKVSEMWITQNGMDWQKPWSHIVAGMSQVAANVPFGTAIAETATNYLNSTAIPGTAAGSNTAALIAGLGGHYQITAQAGSLAAAAENIITSYQIPVQSATQASKRFYCTGIHITGINTGAAVATTPTTLLWGVAWGHTAVSLATTDAVNTKAPRHMKVGTQYFAIGAVVGQNANDINVTFANPFCVNPGEFIQSTLRFVVGTATASQVITGSVSFEGYWE